MTSPPTTQPLLDRWDPTAEQIAAAHVTGFARELAVDGYAGLLAAAAADPGHFHERLVRRLDLRWDTPWREILDLSRGKALARWFPGASMNAAANCLDRHVDAGRGNELALVWEGEEGAVRRYTFAELREAVARLGAVLRDCGIGPGDTVGMFMPLIPEAAIGLLAIGYIGAIAVPAFSGYGPDALATRLADSGAKLLLTVDGVNRRGKPVDSKSIADEALRAAPSVRTVLVFERIGLKVPMQPGRDRSWTASVDAATPLDTYARTSANDRMMLLYTPGSTGKPKGVNHVHGGFPIKAQSTSISMDVRPGDRMLWYTDMGWMMGPWLSMLSLAPARRSCYANARLSGP